MPCELETIQSACCESQICRERDAIELLQLTAQAAANWVTASDPGADTSVDAIMTRACASGIAIETDEVALLNIIAQNLCNQIT
jgi:hypothetical protein